MDASKRSRILSEPADVESSCNMCRSLIMDGLNFPKSKERINDGKDKEGMLGLRRYLEFSWTYEVSLNFLSRVIFHRFERQFTEIRSCRHTDALWQMLQVLQ